MINKVHLSPKVSRARYWGQFDLYFFESFIKQCNIYLHNKNIIYNIATSCILQSVNYTMTKTMEHRQDYQKSILINATPARVFGALTIDIDKWWGPVDALAKTKGDIFKISFGGDSYWRLKVIDINEFKNVDWECVESHQDHNIKGMDEEWLGSKLKWEIIENDNNVEVKFLHQGLVPQGVCYGACSSAWDFYVAASLKSYIEKGKGKPEDM